MVFMKENFKKICLLGKRKDLSGARFCNRFHVFVVSALMLMFLSLSGCSDHGTVMPDGPVDMGGQTGVNEASSTTEGLEGGQGDISEGVIEEGLIGQIGEDGIVSPPEGSISEGRTSGPMLPVYFNFDSFTVDSGMTGRMERNAAFLIDHPRLSVEIQGNCDERGTSEYNLALGEKRAKAASRYLVNLGIDDRRISVVSLGEEKPLAIGGGEKAWAENRRADFVLVK